MQRESILTLFFFVLTNVCNCTYIRCVDLKLKIAQWLDEGGSYEEGVALYAECKGVNKLLLKRLQRSSLPWARTKLKHELKKLAAKQIPPKPSFSEITTTPPSQEVEKVKTGLENQFLEHSSILRAEDERPSPILGPEPFQVAEIKRLRNRAYRERDHLHANLENYSDEEQRYKVAARIVELQGLIQSYWEQLDGYTRTGAVPPIPEELNLKKQIIGKFQRQKNVRSAISQRKSWIKKEQARKLPDASKIRNWEVQQADLERELQELDAYLSDGDK